MNRINKNNRETEITDGLKRGTVVGKQMTITKVWYGKPSSCFSMQ